MSNIHSILMGTGLAILVIGFISLLIGLFTLITKPFSNETKKITHEIIDLTSKGIITDIGSSMENASFLIKELNEMIKTAKGIGVVLILFGCLLIVCGYVILTKLQ